MSVDAIASTIQLIARITSTQDKDLADQTDPLAKTFSWQTSDTSELDEVFHDRRTLAGGATETLTLDDDSISNAFNSTISFSKLAVLMIVNRSTDDETIRVGDATTAFTGFFASTVDIPPGGAAVFVAPSGLTVGSGEGIKVENLDGGDSVEYDIVIAGLD